MQSTLNITELFQYGERVTFQKGDKVTKSVAGEVMVIFISYHQVFVHFLLFLATAKKQLISASRNNNLSDSHH